MKVAIIGSRTFNNKEKFLSIVSKLPITKIVSGEALGADKLAKEYARENNIEYIGHKAKWITYGKAAGPIRNRLVIDDDIDEVIAFWDMKSPGTKDAILYANKIGKKVTIVRI